MKYQILTKSFLKQEYQNNFKSTTRIAKEFNIPEITIWRYLNKYNIPLRSRSVKTVSYGQGIDNPNYKTGEFMQKHYCIGCNKEICIDTYLYGSKKCGSCSQKGTVKKGTSLAQQGRNNNHFGKPASNGKRYWYKNYCFRSTWETLYAKYLDRKGIEWQYESKTFNLGNITYTPDFYLPKLDIYIEVKGFWWKKQKEKFIKFKRQYSNINIKLLMKKDLQKLKVI